MCGITGFIHCGDVQSLKRATRIVAHRGPDHEGIRWFPEIGCGLGHRRLSIIDLSESANQPMGSADGRYWIVFNGEIYNYREIRNELERKGVAFRTLSDTEVVLCSYILWGEQCLQRFNGIFSFGILDTLEDRLFAARDRMGVKPFYYTEVNGGLIFASEIKSILASGLYERRPDWVALHTPIPFQVGPFTGFQGIRKLMPGQMLSLTRKGMQVSSYFQIIPSESGPVTPGEAIEKLDGLLNDAVRLQMIADVPVGVLLSGGLDSSIISAMMVKNTGTPVRSFTIKFHEKDRRHQGNVDDSYYAVKVANQLELNHLEIILEPDVIRLLPKMIWHLEEPMADPASINTYLICNKAYNNGIKVLLNGMGGDEIFAGYRVHLGCLMAKRYKSMLPGFIREGISSAVRSIPEASKTRSFRLVRYLKGFTSFASLSDFERYIVAYNSALTKETFYEVFVDPPVPYEETHSYRTERAFYDSFTGSYLTRMCYNDTRIYLPDHNLNYSDKASMAASVEGRPPLTDHRIAEFMFSLPPSFRIKGFRQKYLLKKVAEKYFPPEIINRPKAPFSTPLRSWLKKDLKEMVSDLLSENSVKARGIFNPREVMRVIRENQSGKRDHSQLIFRMIVTELWFRGFF